MPKKIPEAEFDEIVAAVTRFPLGASIDDVTTTIDGALPRRTLQRRLAILVNQDP
jgi:hypothetical protein